MSFTDSNLEKNPKLGYYTVGDKTFFSKPQAYIYSTQTGIQPSWHFNAVEYAKCNWYLEPELNLRELYKIRAQQIRDRYDWVRIEASGGGDSTTAIFSFLLNNIHLDEIVFRYPRQFEKNVVGNPLDYSPDNTLTEWEFAAKPLFQWIQTRYPKVKITFHDYSDKIMKSDYLKDESWIFTTQDWFQPGHGAKHDNFDNPEHLALADSGKNIGIVYGIDKPRVVLIDNNWYMYFVDIFANHPNPIVRDYTNITSELFFWSPDLPELVIKQSHMIKNWFDMSQNQHLKHLVEYPLADPNLRTAYESIAKSIIYPDYDPHTWQTSKATNSFYCEMDNWFYVNLQDTPQYQAWKSGLKFLVDNIDFDKFMVNKNKEPTGLRWNKSLFYHLGVSQGQFSTPLLKNQSYRSLKTEKITLWQNKKLKHITV